MDNEVGIPFEDTGAALPETPFRVKCPACRGMNIVHNPNHNCCFECGRKMFVSPMEREARSLASGRPATRKQESHGAYAVDMTFKVIAWVVGIGIALYGLAYSWPIILAGAIILAPIYLFFTIRSRPRGGRQRKEAGAPYLDIRLDAKPDYEPVSPRDGEPGWYEDPYNAGWERYWSGRRWTSQEKRVC